MEAALVVQITEDVVVTAGHFTGADPGIYVRVGSPTDDHETIVLSFENRAALMNVAHIMSHMLAETAEHTLPQGPMLDQIRSSYDDSLMTTFKCPS